MIRWTHGLINRLVKLADIVLLVLATLATALWFGHPTLLQLGLLGLLGIVVHVQVLAATGCYRVERYRTDLPQVGDVALGLVAAAVAVAIAYHAFLVDPTSGIGWVPTWALVSFATLLLGRFVLVRWGWRWRTGMPSWSATWPSSARGRGSQAPWPACRARRPISSRWSGSSWTRRGGRARGDRRRAGHRRRGQAVRVRPSHPDRRHRGGAALGIHLAHQRDDRAHAPGRGRRDRPARPGQLQPRFAEFAIVAGMPSLRVMYQPLRGSLGVLKRVEDIVVSALALALTAPILLVAALAIKLDSRGPVVFLQKRVGFNNKPFTIYKLRTYKVDPTNDGSLGTRRDDPGVTRVGSILRRLSIDELPQLVNVLRGEMSVVGPRPHVPNMQVSGRQYYDVVREYAARYRVKPGITGWGQINGMRGGIDTVEKAARGSCSTCTTSRTGRSGSTSASCS